MPRSPKQPAEPKPIERESVPGLSPITAEAASIGRQLGSLLRRGEHHAARVAGSTERFEAMRDVVLEAIGDEFLDGIGNQLRPTFRRAIKG